MASLLEKLLTPISDASYCGEDGSYDTDFEVCKSEAEKITQNNWEAMATSGERFLIKTSKDMRVLGFLALGSAMTRGANAVAEIANAYATMAMAHWDDIYPKRPNGRVQALKWLVSDAVKTRMQGVTPTGDYETFVAAAQALKTFQEFVFSKFPEQPSFEAFTGIIHEWAEKNKPKVEPPPPEPGSEPADGGSQSGGDGGGLSLASEDDAFLALQRVSGFFYDQNHSNPLAFRLMRMSRWSMLVAMPPNTGGRTMVASPYPDTLAAFRNLHAQADWPVLAENGEAALTQDGMLFWLDLQRFVCAALEGLGGENAACATAIKQELALLLQRLPGLEALSFDDGTAFADSATRDWLETEVAGALGGGTAQPRSGKKKSDIGVEAEEAEKLFASERLEDALSIYRNGMAADSSAKSNFDRKMRMADLCLRGNRPTIALAICEELQKAVDQKGLEAWDPEICVQLFKLLRRACLAVNETGIDPLGTLPSKSLEALSRLARLDPLAAIQSE